VAIKAAVVAEDERESGVRAHLNFGHTIGHGVEAYVGYERIRHGEAVSLGMAAACDLAERRGLCEDGVRKRVVEALRRLELPVCWADLPEAPPLDVEAIWRIMQHDKKNRCGAVRMVLPRRLGEVDVFDDVPPEAIREAVARLGS
jgi:3-dehydroquinate synthase